MPPNGSKNGSLAVLTPDSVRPEGPDSFHCFDPRQSLTLRKSFPERSRSFAFHHQVRPVRLAKTIRPIESGVEKFSAPVVRRQNSVGLQNKQLTEAPECDPCYKSEFMIAFMVGFFSSLSVFFRSRYSLTLEILALRQQLGVLKRKNPRPRLRIHDRVFWIWLRRLWPAWKNVLVIVKPETVVAWQRAGFRLFWRLRSLARRVGRPSWALSSSRRPGNRMPNCYGRTSRCRWE